MFRGIVPLCAVCFLLLACAAKKETTLEIPKNCAVASVILPGNFIIDLAAGAEVTLDPAVQEFALFCGTDAASVALKSAGVPQEEDWRIYVLNGDFAELAEPRAGGFVLRIPAKAVDWIDK